MKHNHVSCIVTTAGGIEEDFIKCLGKTYLGDFNLDGSDLRKRGLNRIGNLVVPNDNYCKFEDWVVPILDTMLREQKEEGKVWAPSEVIRRLGKEIDNEESVYYWAYKACSCRSRVSPSCSSSCWSIEQHSRLLSSTYRWFSWGHDLLSLLSKSRARHRYRPGHPQNQRHGSESKEGRNDHFRRRGMQTSDSKRNALCMYASLGSHYAGLTRLQRNGADYSVYINTGQEFDGSDSGARPDEAISWGKIKAGAQTVKVCGHRVNQNVSKDSSYQVFADATLVFPLLVAATFAKHDARS